MYQSGLLPATPYTGTEGVKYQITVNQAGVVAAGLHEDTDLIDWALLAHIYAWQANTRAQRQGDKVWLNYNRLMTDMPLLKLTTKSAISKRIGRLRALELLETEQSPDKRLFVKVTPYYEKVAEYRASGGGEGVSHRKQVFPTGNRVFPTGNESVSHRKHSIENLNSKSKKGADSPEGKGNGLIDDESRQGMLRFVELGNQVLNDGSAPGGSDG